MLSAATKFLLHPDIPQYTGRPVPLHSKYLDFIGLAITEAVFEHSTCKSAMNFYRHIYNCFSTSCSFAGKSVVKLPRMGTSFFLNQIDIEMGFCTRTYQCQEL